MNNEAVMRPILAGGIAAVESMLLLDAQELEIPFLNQSVSAPIAMGVGVAISSAIGNLGGQYILPKIPAIGQLSPTLRNLAVPAMTGGVSYALNMNNPQVPASLSFAIGATSEIGASYAFDTFWRKA